MGRTKLVAAALFGLVAVLFLAAQTPPSISDPAIYRSLDASLRDIPFTHQYRVRKADAFIAKPWPFTSDEVLIACSRPALNVVRVDGVYAPLNGAASAAHKSYLIEETGGRKVPLLGDIGNDGLKAAGVFVAEADNYQIGDWLHAFNEKLLRDCP